MIITVSRQFGSGGRELGKRLADALGLEYYDRQLVSEIAKNCSYNESYVSTVLSKGGYDSCGVTYGRTFSYYKGDADAVTEVLLAQQKVIKAIGEKGDCVIVGRNAGEILKDYNPIKLFVYADDKAKIKRCKARAAADGESYSDKQYLKMFKTIDKGRKKLHELYSPYGWGEKEAYDLMINTSATDIESIIPPLADLLAGFKR